LRVASDERSGTVAEVSLTASAGRRSTCAGGSTGARTSAVKGRRSVLAAVKLVPGLTSGCMRESAWLPIWRLTAPAACGVLCGGGEPKYVNPAAIRIGGASSTQELTASCGQMSLNLRLVESIGTIVHPPPPLQGNPRHPIDPMP
jgi:hypothetical protein